MTLAQVFDFGPYLNYLSLHFLIGKMGIMIFALWVGVRLTDGGSKGVSACSQLIVIILLNCFLPFPVLLQPGISSIQNIDCFT